VLAMSVGQQIASLREKCGLSVSELSRSVALPADELGAIEAGRHSVGPELIDALARSLAVAPAQLLAAADKSAADIVTVGWYARRRESAGLTERLYAVYAGAEAE
jgi:transcriptional regulator with XRE-family HTH domain